MDEFHAGGERAPVGQLPARADQCGRPTFDLVPIRMARDAHIVEDDRDILAFEILGNSLVAYRAVALRPPQRVAQRLRGSHDIVGQPDLPEVEIPGEMNSEKFVPQRVRGNVEEFDLALHADAKAGVVDMAAGEAGLAQQRVELDPGRPRALQASLVMTPAALGSAPNRLALDLRTDSTHRDTRFDFGRLAPTSKSLADDNKMPAESRLYASSL